MTGCLGIASGVHRWTDDLQSCCPVDDAVLHHVGAHYRHQREHVDIVTHRTGDVGTGAGPRDPAPFAQRGLEPQVRTCSSSCSASLQPLRSWSLRQTRGGSRSPLTNARCAGVRRVSCEAEVHDTQKREAQAIPKVQQYWAAAHLHACAVDTSQKVILNHHDARHEHEALRLQP